MFTIPNLISLLRLIGAPILIWLAQANQNRWVFIVLVVASASDYLDGKIARLLKQESKLGELLDPTTDRIYIAAILFILWDAGILPSWLILLLIVRDLLLLLVNVVLKSRKLPLVRVNFMGKAATFNLLYALPLLYLASIIESNNWYATLAWSAGWAFASWGLILYVLTGIRYMNQSIKSIRFPSKIIVN